MVLRYGTLRVAPPRQFLSPLNYGLIRIGRRFKILSGLFYAAIFAASFRILRVLERSSQRMGIKCLFSRQDPAIRAGGTLHLFNRQDLTSAANSRDRHQFCYKQTPPPSRQLELRRAQFETTNYKEKGWATEVTHPLFTRNGARAFRTPKKQPWRV